MNHESFIYFDRIDFNVCYLSMGYFMIVLSILIVALVGSQVQSTSVTPRTEVRKPDATYFHPTKQYSFIDAPKASGPSDDDKDDEDKED